MHTYLATGCYFTGQSRILEGVTTNCYSTSDCTGPENLEFTQIFDGSEGDINHCCFSGNDLNNARSNPGSLSFTVGGGECRTCARKFIIITTIIWLITYSVFL